MVGVKGLQRALSVKDDVKIWATARSVNICPERNLYRLSIVYEWAQNGVVQCYNEYYRAYSLGTWLSWSQT